MITKKIIFFRFLFFISIFLIFSETNQKSYAEENVEKSSSEEPIQEKIEKKNYSTRMKVAFFSTIISSFLIITLVLKIKSMEENVNDIYNYKRDKINNS